jgi:transcriptional antiterminator NusG
MAVDSAMLRWYAVFTKPQKEQRFAGDLRKRIDGLRLSPRVAEITVPTQESGRRDAHNTPILEVFPRQYVLVRCHLDEDIFEASARTEGYLSFIGMRRGPRGLEGEPTPLSDAEAEALLGRSHATGKSKKGRAVRFEHGDAVRIVTGPFTDFPGVVNEVDDTREHLKLLVQIFGRDTPVDVSFSHVRKA